MPRKGMTVRELVVVVVVIAVVAAVVYPFAQWAWQLRQKRLNRELCDAAFVGDWDEARRLVSRGAGVDAKDERGMRARQVTRTFNPGLFRRTLRLMRNLVNTLRDAFAKSFGAILARCPRPSRPWPAARVKWKIWERRS